jgi:hypothetical protein
MPQLPAVLDATRERPNDRPRWLALASWQWDNGRDDEATALPVFKPTLRDNLPRASLQSTLADVARHQELPRLWAREVEGQGGGQLAGQ